jgi:molybdopterin-guanine dinucleotide biosynthesis protein A
MSVPKATLPFGGEPMLGRVVRLLDQVVRPIIVVAAAGQSIPTMPVDVEIAYDRHDAKGPLEGLAAGLGAMGDHRAAREARDCRAGG